jgi:mRNA interferase RelE/StbE
VASYKLLIKSSAAKELESLPVKDRRRTVARIRGLSFNPRPVGSEKLTGGERYRIRQGNYRTPYEIDDNSETVTVVKVAHRREAYR